PDPEHLLVARDATSHRTVLAHHRSGVHRSVVLHGLDGSMDRAEMPIWISRARFVAFGYRSWSWTWFVTWSTSPRSQRNGTSGARPVGWGCGSRPCPKGCGGSRRSSVPGCSTATARGCG